MGNTQSSKPNWKAPFFTIWTGQAISLMGSALVQFGLVWWVTSTTQSATVLATATLIAVLPNIVLGPIAGALVDRWNRRVVMIAADGLTALATLGLAALFALGVQQVWHIYVIVLIRAASQAFQFPAMQASTTLMVPQEQLARVAGLNQTLQGILSIIPPPVGALLLGVMPLQGILAIDVVTALVGIVPLLFIHVPQPQRRAVEGASKPSLRRELLEGWRYMRAWPGLLILMLMAAAINFLLNPAGSLIPILITRHFKGDAVHLASMESTLGIGALIGGVLLSVWGGFKRRMLTSLTGMIGLGISFLIIGVTPAGVFGLALVASFMAGATGSITNGPIFAVLQATVAPEMQGRVFTLVISVATAMSPLGLAVAGPIADTLGVQVWYIAGGGLCMLMGAAGFFIPALMHLEDRQAAAETADSRGAATGLPAE